MTRKWTPESRMCRSVDSMVRSLTVTTFPVAVRTPVRVLRVTAAGGVVFEFRPRASFMKVMRSEMVEPAAIVNWASGMVRVPFCAPLISRIWPG